MHIRASVDIASLFCLVRIAFASEFVYHTAEAQREVLRSLHSAYPKLTRLETIGRFSANPVYTLVISKHGKRRFMIPRVHLLADFPAGTELLLQFGSYILQEYGRTQGITKLIDSTEVHLVPSLVTTNVNETSKKDCSADDRPHDLGKFPDYFNSNRVTDSTRYEVTEEVRLLMEWLRRGKFVLGGHLKGGMGDLVAAYGFHNGLPVSTTNVAPDRDSLVRLARIFAASHPRMKYGAAQCPGGHLGGFPGGVTNALSWKRQPGLLQDYAYVHEGTLVVTLSVSCCRIPQQSQLQTLWNENRIPLLAFLKEVHRGVRGYVKNVDGTHVPGASLVIKGRNVAFKSSEQGEFWRILLPGDYELLVSATGFLPAAVHFSSVEADEKVAAPEFAVGLELSSLYQQL
ncbi:carboxypeptidase M-like [Ornithodoros turicata]|uniref:carboxypeptidase M-like n=1 Tax=Ornithodoros turicata TaxID=34597 RepID=UPI003138A035